MKVQISLKISRLVITYILKRMTNNQVKYNVLYIIKMFVDYHASKKMITNNTIQYRKNNIPQKIHYEKMQNNTFVGIDLKKLSFVTKKIKNISGMKTEKE